MLGRWFKGRNKAPARVPPGRRVYAVGDIHGRLDLLADLLDQIREDALTAPEAEKVIVFLGDYIDRGLDSRAVIDLLIQPPLDGFEIHCLLGNHEDSLLEFLRDTSIGPNWLTYGGDTTLYSYGIALTAPQATPERLARAQGELARNLPAGHKAFLERLELWHAEGDYLFVHAGIRPRIALGDQDRHDLIWIRDPFLSSKADHDHVVVHGHSPNREVEERPNRIGIDTGAVFTGQLTALGLQDDQRWFLHT